MKGWDLAIEVTLLAALIGVIVLLFWGMSL